MVKAFVPMLDLKCDDLVRQLVEVLLQAASESHPVRVLTWMESIIATTLVELGDDEITPPLLDAILENLLPAARDEKPASYNLARKVLQEPAVMEVLAPPLQSFIQGCLPSGSAHIAEESDLRDEWPDLVLELADIVPDTLTFVLPQLQEVVQSDDEHNRERGTALFARLFAQPGLNLVKHFPHLFKEAFLRKFLDASARVRTLMIEHGVRLLRVLPAAHADELAAEMTKRLMDPDEGVRIAFVKCVCEACADGISGALEPLVCDLGGRLNDKKPAVRSAARAHLCALYRRHFTNEALQWIPQKLMQTYGHNGSGEGHVAELRDIEALLHTTLLPQEAEPRLRALLALHATLLPRQRKALRNVLLRGKKLAQRQVQAWLELLPKVRADPKDKELKQRQACLVDEMCRSAAEPAKAKEVWEHLGACKDKGVVTQLRTLCSATSDYDEVVAAEAALRKCPGLAQRLKPEQMSLLSALTSRPSMWFVWRGGVAALLREVQDTVADDDMGSDEEHPTLALLLDVAAEIPEVMEGGEALVEALKAAQAAGCRGVLQQLLQLAHASNTALARASTATRKALVDVLCREAGAKDAATGKLAAQCLATEILVPAIRERTLGNVVKISLAPKATAAKAGPQQHCALAALAALAKRTPDALDEAPQLLEQLEAMLNARQAGGGGSASAALKKARCESQLLALKVLANAALGLCGVEKITPKRRVDGAAASSAESGADRDCAALGKKVAALALRLLERGGNVGAAADAGDDDRAKLRLGAACALLKLVRMRGFMQIEAYLLEDASRWHRLALMMQDDDSGVRRAFANKLYKELQRGCSQLNQAKQTGKSGAPPHFRFARKMGLPASYMSMFALAAVDVEKDNVVHARQCLTQLAAGLRADAERMKKEQPQQAAKLGLEMQVQYLVHVLAHHPRFDEQLDDEPPTLLPTQRCLDFFLGAVASGAEPHYDLLRRLLGLIKTVRDKYAPERRAAHVVADVARALLEARTKGSWKSMVVPDGVGLVPLLFQCGPQATRLADQDMFPTGFKLMEAAGKGGGAAGGAAGGGAGSKRQSSGADKSAPATPKKQGGKNGGGKKGAVVAKKGKGAAAKQKAAKLALASPLPSAGSSRKKPKRRSAGKPSYAEAGSDEDEMGEADEEDDDEDDDEGDEGEDAEMGDEGDEAEDMDDEDDDEDEGGEDEQEQDEQDECELSDDEVDAPPLLSKKEQAAAARKAAKRPKTTAGSENLGPQQNASKAASKAAPAKAKGKPAAAAAAAPRARPVRAR